MRTPSYQPLVERHGDAEVYIADKGNLSFSGMDWPGTPTIYTDGSDAEDYIPDGAHMLPDGAALPTLDLTSRWDCPPPAKFDEVRKLIEQTSNSGELVKPGWERMRHLIGLHLGGPQPANTPHPQTRIEWWRDNAPSNLGYTRRRGWYHGTLPGRDANGHSNMHYGRLHLMTLAIVYEPDHEKRKAAWPFYIQQAISYTGSGRFWSGPWKGMSRDEKGNVYVGDSGKVLYEKDWGPINLSGPWLLTGQQIFRTALENAADFYSRSTYAWGGAWGSRIPGRMLDNQLTLWLLLPEYRWALEREMREVLTILERYFAPHGVWLNLGNNGKGPMSPWMHAEAVAAILRVREHVRALDSSGPWTIDLGKLMTRLMATDLGIAGGSEMVNGYRLFRYRFWTQMATDPMTVTHPVHTAFALPALRMLNHPLYIETRDFIQAYCGSSLADVQAGKPCDINSIGYRFPVEGPAWPKTLAEWADAIR